MYQHYEGGLLTAHLIAAQKQNLVILYVSDVFCTGQAGIPKEGFQLPSLDPEAWKALMRGGLADLMAH